MIKNDKIAKKTLDFVFYFHINLHCHHKHKILRIWCSWCSIADFSSVCTGSSPVIRYLSLLIFLNVWSHYLRSSDCSCMSSLLLLFVSVSADFLKECMGWEKSWRNKKYDRSDWGLISGIVSVDDVWSV